MARVGFLFYKSSVLYLVHLVAMVAFFSFLFFFLLGGGGGGGGSVFVRIASLVFLGIV